jgi:hypothetical protein
MHPRHFSATAAFCLIACATPKPESAHAVRPAAPPAAVRAPVSQPPAPDAPDLRRLPRNAAFADLVDAARAVDSAGESRSEAGCLLREPEPVRLEADLLLAARPLPRPLTDLGPAVVQRTGTVTVLSAWGNVVGDLPDVVLLSFTTTTPNAIKLPIIALFMTRAGTFVRGAEPPIRAHPEALTMTAATALLAQFSGPAAIYVTAEADISINALTELLRAVPNRFELALAVALPKGTRLPPPATAVNELLCPEGLPVPARNEREGALDAKAAQVAFAPLREAALSCALATGGRALLGGRLVLGLRIGSNGKPRNLCFVSDAIGEPLLRRCLISAARDLALPTPRGAGFVDVNLPLEIALEGPSAQHASCE